MKPYRLLVTGAAATLLSAGSALAANSFSVDFAGATGVKGAMSFDFSTAGTNQYYMTIDIFNNTKSTDTTSGVLTGFGLNLPTPAPPTFTFLTYEPLASSFRGVIPPGYFIPVNDPTPYALTDSTNTNLSPLGVLDFCFVSKDNPNQCEGAGSGKPGEGLARDSSTQVKFKIGSDVSKGSDAANIAAVSAAIQQYIYDNQGNPQSGNNSGPFGVVTRWQSITGSLTSSDSDKVVGTTVCTNGVCGGNTGGSPNDPNSVPGPLPLFGAAAAFGYSRKLRHRLKTIPPLA